MKIAIMQPYFLPYIGYFQLINTVDRFVVYDNIKYTKKGWINRNRILVNGRDEYLTLPLKNDSDHLNIDQRFLSESFPQEKDKVLRRIRASYREAPHYTAISHLLAEIFEFRSMNLFEFIFNSLQLVCEYLEVNTTFIVSSTLSTDSGLKGKDKVLAICRELGADLYINPIGGVELYARDEFALNGVVLKFLKTNPVAYPQTGAEFIPNLSILDVMMFNERERIANLLQKEYSLV